MSHLAAARYGKDKVRVVKVVRNGAWHTVVEYTVRALLEGDIETSYTEADNSVVVATDSIKNTVYVKAKESQNAHKIEVFAGELAQHFVQTYSHIHKAHIDIIQHKWTRMIIDNRAHPHSFVRDGDDVRTVSVTASRAKPGSNDIFFNITAGIKDLLVLKSTGSAFYGFIRDKYTTLPEVNDRILSTSIEATWIFGKDKSGALSEKDFYALPFEKTYDSAKKTTIDLFALDDSASVQATLYRMADNIIKDNPTVVHVSYVLPNKHNLGVNLSPFGLSNEGKDTEIFHPVADPSGLITATISRGSKL